MQEEINIIELENNLELENSFLNRYIQPKTLNEFLIRNYKNHLQKIGISSLKNPIYKISIGTGRRNILLWTQMHGNETTGTLSVLDLLKFLKSDHYIVKTILKEFTLDIIPVLNPDGAEIWTRRNIMNIDINRDFLAETSVEMRILKNIVKEKKYDLAYNLHDQRTIFGVKNTKEPATLAFLSPSVSEDRSLTETRKKSMGLIADIYKEIFKILPNKIARFSDEFYPRSVGDNFQKLEIPTLLFEGGHFPNDYSRQKTRKYFTLSLITSLHYASRKKNWETGYENYFSIPENSISFYDIIYRNVQLSSDEKNIADIGIQYTEKILPNENEISFFAKIEEIGDLSFMQGHLEIDAGKRVFSSKENEYPYIGMPADFQLDEWHIINGKKLNQFA